MDGLLLVARCALALVFAVAAIAKLADRAGFRATLAEFGAPERTARIGAIAVPAAELAIAALLVPAATARIGAVAAFVLLAGFCLAIARVLRRGETPDCGCFGSAQSNPVGPWTLARNAVLGGIAALVAAAGPGGGFGASPVVVLVAAAFTAQAWFSWQLFRQHGRLLERVHALEEHADDHPPELVVRHRHRRGSLDQRLRNLED